MEKEKKESVLKTTKAVTLFALVALVGGFLFLSPSITGGAILQSASGFRPLSAIGLGLIVCAIVLAGYALKKK